MSNKDVVVLGIESSCDETASAVVINGRNVISNVISSQIDIHREFGGVVPEIASRKHIEVIDSVILKALSDANMDFDDIDLIGVTYGPGLIGSLLVGLSEAKAISYAKGIPFVGVNHIEGHIAANYLDNPELEPPYVCLVASGGHSHIVHVKDYTEFQVMGKTTDDAAGEAFDKVSRVLGLGYPGGPAVDNLAKMGSANIEFPMAFMQKGNYDFSFSGIKTAVINYLKKHPDVSLADVAASFQKAVVDVLSYKLFEAAKDVGVNVIAIAGGVASNSGLRKRVEEMAAEYGFKVYRPKPVYCTDNAAMIASAAYFRYERGYVSDLHLNAVANLNL